LEEISEAGKHDLMSGEGIRKALKKEKAIGEPMALNII
jgi:hypothetical protein